MKNFKLLWVNASLKLKYEARVDIYNLLAWIILIKYNLMHTKFAVLASVLKKGENIKT